MKYGFYFRFKKIISSDAVCCFLARLAYALYCVLYLLHKVTRKKSAVTMTAEAAHAKIDEVYPHPESKPEYSGKAVDENVDLSVIVPVYNYASSIRENVSSILSQKTRFNFEVLLVDDGSTDGSGQIIEEFATDKRVKIIHQQNGGIAAARNTGLNNAVGKYIMFVDCDDVVHDDIVEVLMSKAYEGDFGMVMCGHNLSKERDGVVVDKIPNIYPNKNLIGYKNGDEIMNLAGLPWCKVYKRELWENVRFFPGYWYEDSIIHMLIFAQLPKYAYVPKIEYEYRWNDNNFSHIQGNSTNIKTVDRYWIFVDILNRYEEMKLPVNDAFYTVVLRHLSTHYYGTIRGLAPELVEALFVLAKEIYLKYEPNHKVKLPYMLGQVEKAFDRGDIELWKLASCYC